MKHSQPDQSLSTELAQCLTQFDKTDLITTLSRLSNDFGIFIVNNNHHIIFWNHAIEKLLGYPASEVKGRACNKELDIDEQTSLSRKTLNLSCADGGRITVQFIAQVILNANNEFLGAIGLLLSDSNQSLQDRISNDRSNESINNFYGILSRSPQMEPVFQIIRNAAKTETTVLVRGESGSGKELVARAIHDLSPRSDSPFLAINCAALSINLLESELFGHVRGAFSGAIRDHAGLFQRAHRGTLFLDEVAELPMELQAKLLRVLQERNFTPVGGSKSIDTDVRIVAATHRSLRDQVKQGLFREDLMYRLRVVPIFIPALRERREDIPLLLWYFIEQHNKKGYRKVNAIDPTAMRLLLDYPWPGNIRELQNVMEYAFVVGHETTILSTELPPEFQEHANELIENPVQPLLSVRDEKAAIMQALTLNNNKVTLAAKSLGMSRATFWRKRKQYGI